MLITSCNNSTSINNGAKGSNASAPTHQENGYRPDHDASPLLGALWGSCDLSHQIGCLNRSENGGFSNRQVRGIEDAIETTKHISRSGMDAYFACAEYASPHSRRAENAVQSRALWLDIDCGTDKATAGKGYTDIAEAQAALVSFCEQAALPKPNCIVNSGSGIHCYWTLTQPVKAEVWPEHAKRLKELTAKMGLRADPSRTADIASVLRVPGTLNYKYNPPRPVTLMTSGEPFEPGFFLSALKQSFDAHCAPVERVVRQAASHDARVQGAPGDLPDLLLLASALRALDPDCDEATWKLRRLAPVARAAQSHPQLAEELRNLAMDWSSGDLCGRPSSAWSTPGNTNGLTGAQSFPNEWARFSSATYRGQPVTLGTIYHDAREAGWTHPKSEKFDDDVYERVPAAELPEAQSAAAIAADLIHRAKRGDAGAPLETGSISALAALSQADYARVRSDLKTANRHVPMLDMDKAVRRARKSSVHTHHGYAKAMLEKLAVGDHVPVATEDKLLVPDWKSNLWLPRSVEELAPLIAEEFDDQPNCNRRNDYLAIAQHMLSIAGDGDFFDDGPNGVACIDSFHSIQGGKINVSPLSLDHRQRYSLNFRPTQGPKPRFEKFLKETFGSSDTEAEKQQVMRVQEMLGAAMLGLTPAHQKVFFFYDPIGRAGKGTLMRILEQLVPSVFSSAVPLPTGVRTIT